MEAEGEGTQKRENQESSKLVSDHGRGRPGPLRSDL